MSEKLVTLTIDGREVSVPAGTMVVDAAKRVGIDIPVFCYHPKLEPVGMCRMCLVEVGTPQIDRSSGNPVLDESGSPVIQFGSKLTTACTTPVSEGMVVLVQSEAARAGRKQIVEFLLTSHPLDCPICDKGGECPLQNLTMAHGPGKGRFIYDDKMKLAKHVPLGELIYLDRERCIQCARCVRFQEEIVDDPVLGFAERGRRLEIVTFSDPGFDSYFSGNTTDICPVGALTTADFRFGARPWEMNNAASICPHCPVGCNLTMNTRREAKQGGEEVIKRVMPRQNEMVNEIWICDKGRFGHHFAASPKRLSEPLIRVNGKLEETSWEEALNKAALGLRATKDHIVAYASGRLSNEDLFQIRTFAEELGGTAFLRDAMGGGEVIQSYGVPPGTNIADLTEGDAILVVATDLHEEAPIWWLRVKQATVRGVKLVVANARETRLDAFAEHSLRYDYRELLTAMLSLADHVGGQGKGGDEWGAAGKTLADAGNVLVFFGREGLDLHGSEQLARICAKILTAQDRRAKVNNGIIPVWPNCNTQGAWDIGLKPSKEDFIASVGDAIGLYLVGVDPVGESAENARAINGERFVVVQDLFRTPTAELADVVLPARSFAEREGTYTSGERRVQRFYPAIRARGEARSDWQITAQLAELLEIDLEDSSVATVFTEIANAVPEYQGLNYADLAEFVEQWPDVGGEDLYFGGTSYKNKRGMGVTLPLVITGEEAALEEIDTASSFASGDGWLLVPITRLYGSGRIMTESQVLTPRLEGPMLWLSAEDAHDVGISDGQTAKVPWNGSELELSIQVSELIPNGVALLGRMKAIAPDHPVYRNIQLKRAVGAE